MTESTVAVVDLGSNSIKLLVARRPGKGPPELVHARTIDARLGTGITHNPPRLEPEAMDRGIAAVKELLAEAAAHSPGRTVMVATSAVRDAVNGPDFQRRILAETGHELRILSGDEEAALIGRGIVCDPALARLQDFYLFDLGGGSLECLTFCHRVPVRSASLPLGCVRLMEKFVPDPAGPFPPGAAAAILDHVGGALDAGGWVFTLPAGSVAVGTGGTVTTIRAITGAAEGKGLEQVAPVVPVSVLREALDRLGRMNLAERRRVPGLPQRRADVFPTALATLIALAEHGGLDSFHHSFHNLRWGIAAGALDA